MTYRVHIVIRLQPVYLAVEARLQAAGFAENQLPDRLNEIAAIHFAGQTPSGVTSIGKSQLGYDQYAFDFGGHKFAYQVRPPDEVTIIDIRLGLVIV